MYGSNIAKRHTGRTECPSSSGRWADEMEQRLIRAYFRLVRAADHSDRLRTITVASSARWRCA
jgi:hypothetical protein